ncbi:MAG: glutamyl-tRNA reductase, partial [Gammaproteobacteria bacterium]|nr:glutamyl-tRNA reductase [Gemmatimonadota bacterium]NIU78220.1 glutamyl-tRNA reductase [Gammaproteobacteria bacterium]
PEAERVVTREVGFFWEWYRGRGVVDTIRALRSRAAELRDAELEKAL